MSRKIINKKFEVEFTDLSGNKILEKTNYKDLIISIIDQMPQGITISEMKKRGRIEEAIKNSKNGEIILEDADFDKLKECKEKAIFRVRSKGITDFSDYIDGL